jgi:hypothetical protein
MADFTLSSGSICRPYRSPWGAFPIRQALISSGVSSLAINLGQVVMSDTRTSTCEHRVKASVLNSDILLWGVAAETVSGATATMDTKIPVWEANPMVEFKAVTKGGTLVSSLVGSARSIVWDSTLKIVWVDLGASSAADNRVLVTELIDAVGDSGGYVAFRFMQTERSSTNNSSTPFLALYSR